MSSAADAEYAPARREVGPDPNEPDPESADARAAALTGTELEHLEQLLPDEHDQEILNYAHGAHIGLPEIVALTVDAGALAAMVEHQSRTIRALQARLARLLAGARKAAAQREGAPE